jgi:hypothetical protein
MGSEDIVFRLKKKLAGLEDQDLTLYTANICAQEVEDAIHEIERLRGYFVHEGWGLEHDGD